ncbi:ABC transporter substrate-binding protein [Paenibacillus flagellatus]|uniref:ABC transporter substrate-binding protein n=2 Tax=Paenibacillus flagellatus TaxID=2211139 RepID=A0A2V5KEA6_9BACL|nr:ABC transporter substrate-binding protein [Paenibacillus flagellatus]
MALLMAGSLAITAACGTSGSNSDTDSSSTTPTTADKPKPTLRNLSVWMQDDYNHYPVAKMLEEKTGYKVQYDMLPQENVTEKLNLLIASAEPYDVVTTLGTSSYKALYSDYAKRGALVDLGPLIDKYGPHIKASLSQETLDAAKVDGKLYGIPVKTLANVSSSLMIRKDWLDKLGLKMPTTTDELVAVLKAFKEKDPGGNGAKNIPFAISGTASIVENLAGAFGIPNTWNEVDGKLLPRAMDPAYKDYVTFMNNLFNEGLLDKEFPINQAATVNEKFTSGRVGVIAVGWAGVPMLTDALIKNNPNAQMVYMPTLKGPKGKFGLSEPTGFDRITFIPKASKNPEDAIKWINAKLDKDTFRNTAIGEENKHYTFKDGAYTPILPIFNDERNQAVNFLTGSDEKNYPTYWQARVRKDSRLFAAWEYLNVKEPASIRVKDPLGMSPYLQEYSKHNASLSTMVNDQTVKYISGGEPISSLDAFIAKFKAAGGEASVKEVNDWYTATKK